MRTHGLPSITGEWNLKPGYVNNVCNINYLDFKEGGRIEMKTSTIFEFRPILNSDF